MTTDEFAKTASALLVEGLALLCGHADDWPAIERHAKAVTAWRAQYRAAKEAPAPAPKTCGSPVSGGRNCGDTTVATGSPITIVCGRCRTGRPPVDGARCRVCGHYETSIEHATEKYAHCPSCGRAPHWMPVKDDDPANNSKHSEWEVHPTGTVAKILASEPIPAPAPEPSAPPRCCAECSSLLARAGEMLSEVQEEPEGYQEWGADLVKHQGHVPVEQHWCLRDCTFPGCLRPKVEPSAPPTGVPVCHSWCGTAWDVSGRLDYCTPACRDAGRPLNPPPSAPVTVATGGVPDDEIPTAEEGAEAVKRLGIDVPAWAADVRARVAAVATGGVPAGYRLGDGWRREGRRYVGAIGYVDADAPFGHITAAGALVPIDTARSVPPGPVPVEAPLAGSPGWSGQAIAPLLRPTQDAIDQADAIKAAVAAANNRAADAFFLWANDGLEETPIGKMDSDQFEAWLRSGEAAPGAVSK